MAIATRILFEMMHFKPSTAILFGDSCSRVTVPIAETAVWWNLAQVISDFNFKNEDHKIKNWDSWKLKNVEIVKISNVLNLLFVNL